MKATNTFEKLQIWLNRLMVIACSLILLLCYFNTKVDRKDASYTQQIQPYSTAVLSNGVREYYFDLTDLDYRYTAIMFYTSHQDVQVYNSGRLIYSYDKDGGIWGSTPGSNINIVEVNEKMLKVAVKLTPIYDEVKDQEIKFYVGSAYQMYDEVLADSMPRFISSLLIIIFSGILFVYYAAMHKKQGLNKDLLYLAYFALCIGIWTASETDAAVLIFNNRVFDAVIPYVCLMLVVPPFILFFDSYLEINSKILKPIVLSISMVETIGCCVLHLAKIAEFRQTLPCIQLMLLVAAFYMVGGVFLLVFRRRFSRRLRICGIGLLLFMISIIGDIFNYYKGVGDSDRLGRYLFLVFIIMLASDLIKSAYEMIEKGRRAKQLEIFALTDTMTGLFNRNAFESQAQAEKSLEGVTVVVADANGLKACNDTYGHEAGDEYITIVADTFGKVFGKYGNCYRTGGDEFCCIIPPSHHADMERLKKIFLTKIYTANLEGNHKYDIGVAIGYAVYDATLDEDFRAIVKRADASMYENKKKKQETRMT
ncbi:diguanylate cyclase (GGDEF) domain-containing protein [Pseudobutyrivibrio sp. YE44]|uniref:sensor domain-containing diguanylate cyclase n=1 Tax=Pseudobutyrivibrio sp. YE44 TaxID=1520802 RepID=UPI00087E5BCF|nr:diguanylate cyclase [Pseudobutyrivibrio sp. YE44]SDB25562.1 diguanylate cyclase (GGDEF) domain-containing protein [Pseudobutyrivibrio sp. YE44]